MVSRAAHRRRVRRARVLEWPALPPAEAINATLQSTADFYTVLYGEAVGRELFSAVG
jgi:hypothetical protein